MKRARGALRRAHARRRRARCCSRLGFAALAAGAARCAVLVVPLALCAVGRAVLQPSLMSLASLAAGAARARRGDGRLPGERVARARRRAARGGPRSTTVATPAPFLLAGALAAFVALAGRRCPRPPRASSAACLASPGGLASVDLSFFPPSTRRSTRSPPCCSCVGRRFARAGRIDAHRRTMLAAFATSTLFLALYVLHKASRGFESTTFHVEGAAHARLPRAARDPRRARDDDPAARDHARRARPPRPARARTAGWRGSRGRSGCTSRSPAC